METSLRPHSIFRAFPTFVEPVGPDATPIAAIHGEHDGFVPFMRKGPDGSLQPLCNVRATDLATVMPEALAELLDHDGYFGINGVFAGGKGRSPTVPGQPSARWGTEQLRWLTACWVDCDCHKLGITPGKAIGTIIDLQDSGAIPPASMLTRSGRGVWAFWFLRDPSTGLPVRSGRWSKMAHARIERRLLSIFDQLGVDGNAMDLARITRAPGSLSRAAGARVSYWLQADAAGMPFTYTLETLARALGITCPPRGDGGPGGPGREKDAAAIARGIAGQRALGEKRHQRLLQLIEHRGMIREGCRNSCALLLSAFMGSAGRSREEITAEVEWLCNRCEPRLPAKEAARAIEQGAKYRKFSDATIAAWLGITLEESNLTGWPIAGQERANLKPGRRDLRAARCHVLRALCPPEKKTPPLRALKEALSERGLSASLPTIRADLDRLLAERKRAA